MGCTRIDIQKDERHSDIIAKIFDSDQKIPYPFPNLEQ